MAKSVFPHRTVKGTKGVAVNLSSISLKAAASFCRSNQPAFLENIQETEHLRVRETGGNQFTFYLVYS